MVATVKKYVAHDGTEFDTRAEAVAHDDLHEFDALIGLNEGDIALVLSGDNRTLGDVFERIAARISRKRRKSGDLKRNMKPREAKGAA